MNEARGAGRNEDAVPFDLRYSLPWRWTLRPHVRLWGPLGVLLSLVLFGLGLLQFAVVSTGGHRWRTMALAATLFLSMLLVAWLGRGFYRGIRHGLRRGAVEI